MRKLRILTAAVFLICCTACSFANAADENISVYLNGEPLSFSQSPYMKNDRVMVPMRDIFEKLGAAVTWDGDTQSVNAEKDGITATVAIGADFMNVNGGSVALDASAELNGSKTFVPLRAVSEVFGCAVSWSDAENRVDISCFDFAGYAEFGDVADFGKCIGISPIFVIAAEEFNGYIYSYDLHSAGAGCGMKYRSVLESMGFSYACGNGYDVYTKDKTTVLAGIAGDVFRVVVYRD